ncbi:hypothetical protein KAS31_00760 [Candidatus Parcubacteria bacterium]|nr:hypothetical protein [Candidatus Parcubacteria bacterium]
MNQQTKTIGTVLIVSILAGAGAIAVLEFNGLVIDHNELSIKYDEIVEWENGSYGRITWVQDTDGIKATEFIAEMNLDDISSKPNGSVYLICPSKSDEAGKVGVCFYDPTADFDAS